jgi:cysteine desulfurase
MMINLDYNATTPLLPVVREAMECVPQGNSHSAHMAGIKAKLAEKKAEEQVKHLLGTSKGRIVWTSSGSEANRLTIQGLCKYRWGDLVTTGIEHKSIDDLWRAYGNAVWPRQSGLVYHKDFERYVGDHVKLVSMMLVNNETGLLMPVDKLKLKFPNTLIHTDAVQALGKMNVHVDTLGVDLVSLSAHKIGGPKGIGALWIKDGVDINLPYLGTANTPGIVGFGVAAEQVHNMPNRRALYRENCNIFFRELIRQGAAPLWRGVGDLARLAPGTMSLYFKGVDADELMMCLSTEGVMISTGSACGGGRSHVLERMGLSDEEIDSTVRISPGMIYGEGELAEAAGIVARVAKELGHGS